jgi:hypothetical protein
MSRSQALAVSLLTIEAIGFAWLYRFLLGSWGTAFFALGAICVFAVVICTPMILAALLWDKPNG